jgi:aspartate kinase
MFGILSASGVNIEMISTSTIRISCIIRSEDTQKAIEALHRQLIGERS